MSDNPIISLSNIVVDFDGFKAVNDVSLSFPYKGVHFIIGPNGAGKTTILDVICGRVKAHKGKIVYKGQKEIQNQKPERIVHWGISRKFQRPSIFHTQTVYENLKLAVMSGKSPSWYLYNFKLPKTDEEKIDALLERVDMTENKYTVSGTLPHGKKQWLEIAMAIINNPELLLVDEPIAGLTPSERDKTGELLQEIGKERTVFVVEHDMKFVKNFSSNVVVMHEGKVICKGLFTDIVQNQQVIDIYLGRE